MLKKQVIISACLVGKNYRYDVALLDRNIDNDELLARYTLKVEEIKHYQ